MQVLIVVTGDRPHDHDANRLLDRLAMQLQTEAAWLAYEQGGAVVVDDRKTFEGRESGYVHDLTFHVEQPVPDDRGMDGSADDPDAGGF